MTITTADCRKFLVAHPEILLLEKDNVLYYLDEMCDKT